MTNKNFQFEKENIKKQTKPTDQNSKIFSIEEPRMVLKDVGNTKSSEDYLNYLKKRTLKDTIVTKPNVEDQLDDSLLQVFPKNRESENTRNYKNAILANELTVKFEEQKTVQSIIDNKLKSIKKDLKDREKTEFYDKNPQYVSEYLEDIINHLKETELVNTATSDYMKNQYEVTPRMRAILVDWLVEVHRKFKLVDETLYLTINLIDRFLKVDVIERKNFQLLGVTCMLIASKYEEIYAPEIRDFVYVTDKAYNRENIMKMESRVLSKLKFDIQSVSPFRLLECIVFMCGDNRKLFNLSQFILELSLVEYTMWKYIPSVKACASVFIARKILKLLPTWPKNLVNTWDYTEVSLRMCLKDLCCIIDMSSKCSLKGVRNKFSSVEYDEVSKLPIFNN